MATTAENDRQTLEPAAFSRVYPEQFYNKFIESGLRPDGRTFGQARPVSVAHMAVDTADSSVLVKVGNTKILAGLKLEVHIPSEEDLIDRGKVVLQIEALPMSSANFRNARLDDTAQCCCEQINSILDCTKLVNTNKLIIEGSKAVWIAYVDMYIIDADGALLDACLLGATACLAGLKHLPHMSVSEDGKVHHQIEDSMSNEERDRLRLLEMDLMPVALTSGLYHGNIISDPTGEEEALIKDLVTVFVESSGNLLGVWKPGGLEELPTSRLIDCIEAAKLRHAQVVQILKESLEPSV